MTGCQLDILLENPLVTRLEHLMTARLEAGRSVRPAGSRHSFVSRRLHCASARVKGR
ncbi:hypothetical protein [Paenibacillus terrae]|uniref:hypothetical protein n=1 Tax=Paenibacillus terrae TaxID=159743 RepID=UPI0016568268|nr:hypothetical protein [Paenibacillus terrae]